MITSKTVSVSSAPSTGVFVKRALVKGQPSEVECLNIDGQTYSITRGAAATVVSLEEEWYEDIQDPLAVVDALRSNPDAKADIFTFWQRYPDVTPRYSFHQEQEYIAVLPVKSLDHWLNHQIKPRVRTSVRKAPKEGLVVRETSYDDAFVRGMTAIFNEAPVRQGRPFWHYGKDFATVKKQFSRCVDREYMIGAYYQEEMIGLVMLANAGRFGLIGQIISSLKHRDKSTNVALVAAAVEACAARGLEHLIYLFWSEDSLSEFKRRCGFERVAVPRYYIPLTWKGKLALKTGLHRGLVGAIPPRIKKPLKDLRRSWYVRRTEKSEN